MDGGQRSDAASGATQGEPSLGWLLSASGQHAAAGFRAALPDGIHPRQAAVLLKLHAVADDAEPGSQRSVAEALGIPPSRLVSLIDDLEARGWVERVPGAHDRRANHITLTPAGHRAAAGLVEVAGEYDEEIAAGLTAAERARLVGLLQKLTFSGRRPDLIW